MSENLSRFMQNSADDRSRSEGDKYKTYIEYIETEYSVTRFLMCSTPEAWYWVLLAGYQHPYCLHEFVIDPVLAEYPCDRLS
jgi:hypothetical protein